jgi:agmatinase
LGQNIGLLAVKDTAARLWYAEAALEHGWSRRVLSQQLRHKLDVACPTTSGGQTNMTSVLSSEPRQTFAGLPFAKLDAIDGDVRIGILGADHGSPYKPGIPSHAAGGATALRRGAALFSKQLTQFDFDLGSTLLRRPDDPCIVDCGDLDLDLFDGTANRTRITKAVSGLLEVGVVPVVLGGDDSVPIPVFAAYEGRGPITMIQIDAHVDWGDTIMGNRFGYGSPMRRAAEMPWIKGMVQVGIRGLGSGMVDQHDDARTWGSKIFTMQDLRRGGMNAALSAVPQGGDCFVTIDFDGLDPSVVPAVNMPTPGGLLYQDVLELLQGVARKSRIVGATLVEFVPTRDDRNGLAAVTAARITLSTIGFILLQ